MKAIKQAQTREIFALWFSEQISYSKMNGMFNELADDYAIEFGVWLSKQQIHYERYYKKEHYKELLKEFKKEKGL
jgi:hypothetical protein